MSSQNLNFQDRIRDLELSQMYLYLQLWENVGSNEQFIIALVNET